MIVSFRSVLMAGICLLTYSFSPALRSLQRRKHVSIFCMEGDESKAVTQLRQKIQESEFAGAYQVLRKNPLISLDREDARLLLNNLDRLVESRGASREEFEKQQLESCSLIYSRLSRQHVLRGFGCVDGEYPSGEISQDISPMKLEELSGLNMASLTPKGRGQAWRFAGIALVIAEYLLGTNIGIDPLVTIIPATFFLFGLDQLANKGAVFETIYQTLFPQYKEKIIYHEAGHFLIAYILGLPIQDCVTNAWDAKKYSKIPGQAGTVFYDMKFQDEIKNKKVTRTSLDRLAVVIMAGIAAEGLHFGRAEGGVSDEQELINVLSFIKPPWNIMRVQAQARWGALQSVLLIKEHKEAYDALVKALQENKSVGDCILAIEENLPANLPSTRRINERNIRIKTKETNELCRHVQRMTNKVGGIEAAANDDEALKIAAKKSQIKAESFSDTIRTLEEVVKKGKLDVGKDKSGGIWLNDLEALKGPNANNATTSPNSTSPISFADLITKARDDANVTGSSSFFLSPGVEVTVVDSLDDIPDDMKSMLEESSVFKRIKEIETEASNINDKDERKKYITKRMDEMKGEDGVVIERVNFPQEDDDDIAPAQSATTPTPELSTDVSKLDLPSSGDASDGAKGSNVAEGLLRTHRGYQLKKVEIEQAKNRKKMADMDKRIQELTLLNPAAQSKKNVVVGNDVSVK